MSAMTDTQHAILDNLSSWAWKQPQTPRGTLHELVDAGLIEHKTDVTGSWYRLTKPGSAAIGAPHESELAGRFTL